MLLIGVNGRYYTQAGVICSTSAGVYTNREVENESTVGDCKERLKSTWFERLKRNMIYHCIAEVVIIQPKVLYQLWKLHLKKAFGKEPRKWHSRRCQAPNLQSNVDTWVQR